jgi:hypothetical protein
LPVPDDERLGYGKSDGRATVATGPAAELGRSATGGWSEETCKRKALGFVLIVFGVLSGASTASVSGRGKDADERFYMAVGAVLFSLTAVVVGFLLVRSGSKRTKDRERQPRNSSRDQGEGPGEKARQR